MRVNELHMESQTFVCVIDGVDHDIETFGGKHWSVSLHKSM